MRNRKSQVYISGSKPVILNFRDLPQPFNTRSVITAQISKRLLPSKSHPRHPPIPWVTHSILR